MSLKCIEMVKENSTCILCNQGCIYVVKGKKFSFALH